MRDRIGHAIGAIVDGYQELRLDGVDALKEFVRAVLAAPFRQAQLHVDEIGDPAAELLECAVRFGEVPRVQKGDPEIPHGIEVSRSSAGRVSGFLRFR